MSIQRYAFDAFGPAHPGGVIIHADDGPYVTYEDHVAALRACEERVRGCMCPNPNADCEHPTCPRFVPEIRRQNYAAGVQAARDAVAALPWINYPSGAYDSVSRSDALAAIDALRADHA